MNRPAAYRLTVALAVAGCLLDCGGRSEQPPNVLLLTVDTLRADRLGYTGRQREVSPALDLLAAEGVRFERSYSQAGWTLPSLGSVLTGLYPGQHGATRAAVKLREGVPTLASILEGAGYETSALVSHGFVGEKYGFGHGFGRFDATVLDVGNPQAVSTAVPLTDKALAELDVLEPPFFLWLHYFDPHSTYLEHPEWSHFGDRARDRYDAEIAHVDRQIGRLLEALERRGLSESTIVVFTADHGEEFGDHGGSLHFGLHEEDIRIPLIIRAPGLEPAVETALAQQIDILPTVLELAGLPPPRSLPGRALLPPSKADRFIFAERERPRPFRQQVAIAGDRKIYRIEIIEEVLDLEERLRKTAIRPGLRIYDLASDPKEKRNLYREGDPESERLVALLDSLAEMERHDGEYIDVSEETRRKLLSLGYLD